MATKGEVEPNNEILVARDYDAERKAFLEGIENEKVREAAEALAPGAYQYARLFPKTEGWGAAGAVRAKVKMVQAVEDRLRVMLMEGEEVRYITRGIYSSFAEQYFLGWIAYIINRTLFVFTNFRILLFNTDRKDRPQQMAWHIPYDQIRNFKTGWISSSMTFKLKDGKKQVFGSVPRADRKPVKAFIEDMVARWEREDAKMPHHASRDALCPACCQPVPAKAEACPHCEAAFIRPRVPALMSLVLPCLGDLYLGHYVLAAVEVMGYAVLWLVLVGMIAAEGLAAALPVVLFLLVPAHLVDAALTRHMAMKGKVLRAHAWGRRRGAPTARRPEGAVPAPADDDVPAPLSSFDKTSE